MSWFAKLFATKGIRRNIKIVPMQWCDGTTIVYAVMARKTATTWAYTCAKHFQAPNAVDFCARCLPDSVVRELAHDGMLLSDRCVLYVFTTLKSANYCVRHSVRATHAARKMSRRLTQTFKKEINTP
jgi:hypothetical protein